MTSRGSRHVLRIILLLSRPAHAARPGRLALGLVGGVGVSYLVPKLLKFFQGKPQNCMADLRSKGAGSGHARATLRAPRVKQALCVPDVQPGDIVRAFPDQALRRDAPFPQFLPTSRTSCSRVSLTGSTPAFRLLPRKHKHPRRCSRSCSSRERV